MCFQNAMADSGDSPLRPGVLNWASYAGMVLLDLVLENGQPSGAGLFRRGTI